MTQLAFGDRGRFFTTTLLLVSIVASACVNWGQEHLTPTPTQSIHLPVLSARAFWAQALATAQEWHPDAYVKVVDVDVPLPTRGSPPEDYPAVRFSFQSPSEDHVIFVVLCNAERCHSFEVEQSSQIPLRQCTPITLNDFTLDSREAIEIGLQYGGEDYVQRRIVSVVFMLYRGGSPSCTGPVEWRVSFTDIATIEELDIFIDAVTGEVIEIRD